MSTIPRTYLLTDKTGLAATAPKNGQVIALWDSDEVYYDAPVNGAPNGAPIRRKISGVKVITTLPDTPMEEILYVYIGDENNRRYLPDGVTPLYDLRVWVNDTWLVVGSNQDDTNVKTTVSDEKFYLAGSANAETTTGSLLKNATIYVQSNAVHGSFYGPLTGTASQATNATNATNDNLGQAITGYLRDVSAPTPANQGTTITFTLGDGSTTKQIITSDTTYNVFTTSTAGLVNGTNTRVTSDSTNLLLTGSGWMLKSNIHVPTAEKAKKDWSDNVITDTYFATATFSTSTRNLVLTKGNSSISTTLNIPDTTYSVVSTTADGLAPMRPGSNQTLNFLRADATWAQIPNYTGATSGAAGVAGLVPPAASGQTADYFLRGNATWGTIFSTASSGIVPAPTTSSATISLKSNGTWQADVDTKDTAGATQDASKLYLVGSKAQNTYEQTYSNIKVYINNDKLYSNNIEVVNLSDSQALTNKTYEGYTLGNACAKTVATTINPTIIAQESFTGTGSTTEFVFTNTAIEILEVTINDVVVTAYTFDNVNNKIIFTSTPASGADIETTYLATNANYVGSAIPTADLVSNALADIDTEIANGLAQKVDNSVIANVYDDTSTSYAIGDYCIYDAGSGYRLFKCNTPISAPAGSFAPARWDEKFVVDIDGKWLTSTLAANATTCTISNANIKTTSTFEFYTDKFGVAPINVSVSNGSITLTFIAQSTGTNVKVRVYN